MKQKQIIFRAIFILLTLLLLSSLFWSGGSSPIKIALIDTGVSTRAISQTHLLEGENFVFSGKNTEDKLGHGTAVASIIVGSESAKIEGVCPNAQIIPLVYASKNEDGERVQVDENILADIVTKAVDVYESDIIVISSGTTNPAENFANAIAYAEERGVVVVSSIGNYHEQNPDAIYYPAAYDTVIAVGACDIEGEIAPFSNRGETLDILANGVNLRVAGMSGGDIFVSGTSFSTAIVAGVCANLLQENPNANPAEIRDALYQSATDIAEAGYDSQTGWGIYDANE